MVPGRVSAMSMTGLNSTKVNGTSIVCPAARTRRQTRRIPTRRRMTTGRRGIERVRPTPWDSHPVTAEMSEEGARTVTRTTAVSAPEDVRSDVEPGTASGGARFQVSALEKHEPGAALPRELVAFVTAMVRLTAAASGPPTRGSCVTTVRGQDRRPTLGRELRAFGTVPAGSGACLLRVLWPRVASACTLTSSGHLCCRRPDAQSGGGWHVSAVVLY